MEGGGGRKTTITRNLHGQTVSMECS